MFLVSRLCSAAATFLFFAGTESDSLMNVSASGTLRCHCEPTDAAEPQNDRRRSCRTCGHAIVSSDPTLLYHPLSRTDIRAITRRLRHAGTDALRIDHAPRLVCAVGVRRAATVE